MDIEIIGGDPEANEAVKQVLASKGYQAGGSQMTLVSIMAKACHYAQEHIDDADAWPTDVLSRENLLQCTSFQMACFFAQNTPEGDNGVEWDVVLEELVERPMKSEEQWEKIIGDIAKELGGWK
jgi:hypothetical protein